MWKNSAGKARPPSYRRRASLLGTTLGLWVPVLLVLAAHTAPVAANPVIKSLRIGAHSDKTRFVIEANQPLKPRVFTLQKPYRVVIDLPEAAWQLTLPPPSTGGGITGLRYGLFSPGTSRIVMDLGGPMKIGKIFPLPPSRGRLHRLVFDLVPVSVATFAKTVGRPSGPSSKVPAVARKKPVPATPSAQPKRVNVRPLIVLDPGHGGVDPGAIGRRGTREKLVTLAFAQALKAELVKAGYRVFLTRERDVFIRLRERIAIARRKDADLFVSIHADSIRNSRVRGGSVYTLSENASDKEAAALAARENKSDVIAGIDLSAENPAVVNILIDLAQRETMNASAIFARDLIPELRKIRPMLRRAHRFAGFAVLKAPDIPSVLLELGFLSNRADEAELRSAAYRTRVARAIRRGIDRFFARQQVLNRP